MPDVPLQAVFVNTMVAPVMPSAGNETVMIRPSMGFDPSKVSSVAVPDCKSGPALAGGPALGPKDIGAADVDMAFDAMLERKSRASSGASARVQRASERQAIHPVST